MYRTGGSFISHLLKRCFPDAIGIRQHVGYSECDPSLIEGKEGFGVLRDPWSWYASRYFQGTGINFNSSITFEEYLNMCASEEGGMADYGSQFARFFLKNQTNTGSPFFISADNLKENLCIKKFVNFSNYDEDLLEILKEYGFTRKNLDDFYLWMKKRHPNHSQSCNVNHKTKDLYSEEMYNLVLKSECHLIKFFNLTIPS